MVVFPRALPYLEQASRWPLSGRHVLANFDDESIIVYQAYRPSIGRYAIEHQAFGGPEFSFSRMSWVKPNFLWMMFRSAWGTADGQEAVLAVRVRRTFFERVLAAAVPSSFNADRLESVEAWRQALARSDVRLQWDPDHDPSGEKLERRAIQVGLRGAVLQEYATDAIVGVVDMTPFVSEQRLHVARRDWHLLQTPEEHVYRPLDASAGANVGIEPG